MSSPPVPHGLLSGVTAAFRGLQRAWTIPDVTRAYVMLSLALLLVTVLLDVLGIALVWRYTGATEDVTWWLSFGLVLLRGLGILVVLMVAPIVALVVVNNVAPWLAERVFLAGLRSVAPARADALAAAPGLPLAASLWGSLLRLSSFLLLSLMTLAISFVPVLGALVSPILQGFLSARALSWELLDPYFDKLGYDFAAQRRFVATHRAVLVGFGLPLGFIMAVPLAGPWLFGLAQASAGIMVGEVLESSLGAAHERPSEGLRA